MKSYAEIEAEVAAFAADERRRLGLDEAAVTHWRDENPQTFTRAERSETTILFGGLTLAHDQLVQAALAGLGYHVQPLDVPDTEALRVGKEFGNRAQCNPTYFTVGNLVKHLIDLRDRQHMPVEEIIRTRLFFTAGACGPCRFGTYVTEYRKALRDAGFDGFRVMLFQQQGGLRQATGDDAGLDLSPRFFVALLKALLVGDILNLIGYRIRPFEIEAGATDRALERSKTLLRDALARRRSLLPALWRARRTLARVRVNRLQAKPKVAIIGEFWAMTTEGDGNYRLQRFLESEGAEVDIQPVTAWLLYSIWEHAWDTRRRMTLRHDDGGTFGLSGTRVRRKLWVLAIAGRALRVVFASFARLLGLRDYHLADMDEIATISHQYYDNHLRGGEGHMEVGKLIQHTEQRRSHMVVSVKPFGCMPSSGVSDGVQSLVTAKHPDALFCAIETTGDGAVNVQSRVLMDLFKARRAAQQEFDAIVAASGRPLETLAERAAGRADRALFVPPHRVAGTAANTLLSIVPGLRLPPRPQAAATPPSPQKRVAFQDGRIRLTPASAAGRAPSRVESSVEVFE